MAKTGKEERAAKKADRAAKKLQKDVASGKVDETANKLNDMALETNRVTSGVLTSHKDSRDIKIEQYSLSFYSQVLVNDTTIELNFGRRYALIGPNGSGKSTFLQSLAAREVPIPEHIDIYLLNSEYPPTEMTALKAVIDDAEKELKRLEQLMENMLAETPDSPLLDDIMERIESMDAATFEPRAASILHGLGFDDVRMKLATKDLSGGWRMRVALARALFVKPTMLLLDEPTNHLDLGACVWLEEYLAQYDRILLLVSHSQDFMNGVCTNVIDLNPKKQLVYYTGNYDSYVKTKEELEVNQMKAYEKQQEEIAHIKQFIASCGTYANLVRQAKSRQKILDKMEADGLIEKVEKPAAFAFKFESAGPLPPPVLSFSDMSFAYNGNLKDAIYRHLEFGADTESRIALVGPNGAGKSTLLKLMSGELSATEGSISRHTHLKIGKYSQHSADQLDLTISAIDYLRRKFPEMPQDLPTWRSHIGRFGLTGASQLCPIGQLSDGQRARIVFCELSLQRPNMLLLDEPTNPLDIETIDSLAAAIKQFEGGVVLVSHDFRLISQVAEQIWVCENGSMRLWQGSISEYKAALRKEVTKNMIKI
ncbi:P-loop containing nucleoside triphosphate hydrolase protein [Fimicolochytrium jonesii]|uniref:P-loop containing nucleoside triphosphate hydrolase protein n=1 Tax=Fimicolochytrium jonesii TaxID=1396493 RepID=UPI0022FDEFC1|nr:P-loop containing nucleoside triphosphate hydrolase protein [Fimicolochytrium jonesii]KAI8818013.1 P-loop containing nucleoside triphosphate hydrolase protein [Fimicolochytrium jonesii]